MDNIIFTAATFALAVCAAIVARYAVPALREAHRTEQYALLVAWTENAVRYARQVMTDNKSKKNMATLLLRRIRDERQIDMTDEQIDVLIEAVYDAIKREMGADNAEG